MNNKMYVACCGNPDDDYVSGVYLNEEKAQEWFKQAVSDLLDTMCAERKMYMIQVHSDTDFYVSDSDDNIYYVRYESAKVKDND